MSTYEDLRQPLPVGHDPRGNPFINIDDTIDRLNGVFGVEGWNFRVLQHGVERDDGEVWVLGELEFATPDGGLSHVQQFGGHKLQRFSRGDNAGNLLDLSNDLQSAATDALKKCAKLRGIGLFLKREQGQQQQGQRQQQRPPQQQQQAAVLRCDECNDEIQECPLQSGAVWTPAQLANEGMKRWRQKLCRTHFIERSAQTAG